MDYLMFVNCIFNNQMITSHSNLEMLRIINNQC